MAHILMIDNVLSCPSRNHIRTEDGSMSSLGTPGRRMSYNITLVLNLLEWLNSASALLFLDSTRF